MKGCSAFVDLRSDLLSLISIMPFIILTWGYNFNGKAISTTEDSELQNSKKERGKKTQPLPVCVLYLEPFAFFFFSLHFLNTLSFFSPFDETDTRILTSLLQFGSCYMPPGNLAQDLCTISCTLSHKSCKNNNNASHKMNW